MRKTMQQTFFICALLSFLSLNCAALETKPVVEHEFTFSKDATGWAGDFADYPSGEENFYELSWGWDKLPKSIDNFKLTHGLFLSGNNHSDDLFMFVKHQIGGLQASTLYTITFTAIIESNVATGLFGVGGSPGESVYVKVGASTEEPMKVLKNGYYRLNIDKGNQSQSGINALVIGDLANESVDAQNPQYFPKYFQSQSPLLAMSDPEGKLWIFLGTDSGFEGLTKYYLALISLTLIPSS